MEKIFEPFYRKAKYTPLPVIENPQILKNVVVKADDPFETLLKYDNDSNAFNSHSDVWLLTNLKRLNFANPSEISRMIDERFKESSSSNPYDGMSDEDIFNTIKSKNIQTASELNSWLDYLDSEQKRVSEEIEKSVVETDEVDVSE